MPPARRPPAHSGLLHLSSRNGVQGTYHERRFHGRPSPARFLVLQPFFFLGVVASPLPYSYHRQVSRDDLPSASPSARFPFAVFPSLWCGLRLSLVKTASSLGACFAQHSSCVSDYVDSTPGCRLASHSSSDICQPYPVCWLEKTSFAIHYKFFSSIVASRRTTLDCRRALHFITFDSAYLALRPNRRSLLLITALSVPTDFPTPLCSTSHPPLSAHEAFA